MIFCIGIMVALGAAWCWENRPGPARKAPSPRPYSFDDGIHRPRTDKRPSHPSHQALPAGRRFGLHERAEGLYRDGIMRFPR